MGKVLDNLAISLALVGFILQMILWFGQVLVPFAIPLLFKISSSLIPLTLILGIVALCLKPEKKWKPIVAIVLAVVPTLLVYIIEIVYWVA